MSQVKVLNMHDSTYAMSIGLFSMIVAVLVILEFQG